MPAPLPELHISRGPLTIADGDPLGAGLCEALQINGVAVLEIATFLFNDTPRVFDREGRMNTLTFRVFQAAGDLATGFDRPLRQALGQTGVADLTLSIAGEDTAATWSAGAAAWRAVQASDLSGEASVLAYEVTCGPLVCSAVLAADLVDGGDDAAPFTVDDDLDGGGLDDDDAACVALIDGGDGSNQMSGYANELGRHSTATFQE